MDFTLLDMKTHKRAQHINHYLGVLKNVICLTATVEVTRLLARTKEQGLGFYPSFLYIVAKTVNNREEFRMGYDEQGNVGVWDEVCPSHILFHPEDETLTRIFTPWNDDFGVFYHNVVQDTAKYQGFRGFSIPGVPPNVFDVSCLPWLHYSALDIHVFDEGTYLAPVISWGKFALQANGKTEMPLTMQIHHAAADGFHVCRFF